MVPESGHVASFIFRDKYYVLCLIYSWIPIDSDGCTVEKLSVNRSSSKTNPCSIFQGISLKLLYRTKGFHTFPNWLVGSWDYDSIAGQNKSRLKKSL
jgi:hypothetical protein